LVGDAAPRQFIGALVLRMTGVAFDPMPFHVMPCHRVIQ
jgi:hypothetical protein